jgi:hypothetical protein
MLTRTLTLLLALGLGGCFSTREAHRHRDDPPVCRRSSVGDLLEAGLVVAALPLLVTFGALSTVGEAFRAPEPPPPPPEPEAPAGIPWSPPALAPADAPRADPRYATPWR